jgi:hypothetical protein
MYLTIYPSPHSIATSRPLGAPSNVSIEKRGGKSDLYLQLLKSNASMPSFFLCGKEKVKETEKQMKYRFCTQDIITHPTIYASSLPSPIHSRYVVPQLRLKWYKPPSRCSSSLLVCPVRRKKYLQFRSSLSVAHLHGLTRNGLSLRGVS